MSQSEVEVNYMVIDIKRGKIRACTQVTIGVGFGASFAGQSQSEAM